MIIYDVLWCSMMFYDALWCSMMLYDVLWCSMMFYDVLWCFMMFFDVLWCSMMFFNLCSFRIGPCGPLWMRWYNRRSAEQELDEFGDGVHKFITLSLSWTNKKLQCKIVSSWDLESETDHYLKHVLQIAEGMNSSRIS